MEFYKHIHTKEIVFKEDAQEYALCKLGITIKPKNAAGTFTKDQLEFLKEFTEWYFSDNWIVEEEKENF